MTSSGKPTQPAASHDSSVPPATTGTSDDPVAATGVSRRSLLGIAGASLALGLGGGFAGGHSVGAKAAVSNNNGGGGAPSSDKYPFTGQHQAGIVTPAQDRLHMAAFDVTAKTRDELISLLRKWTFAASRMTQGLAASEQGTTAGPYDAPPQDTGEAEGLTASGLTITIGFGPALFRDSAGNDRFGIADQLPALLKELPHFPADALDPKQSGGDLVVQACADDPQVAVHAVRNLARLGFGIATVRWSQLGYGRTSSTSTAQTTPRNLFGFKDGTANLKAEEPEILTKSVWVAAHDDPQAEWLTDGSYLVARRISMDIEIWDRQSLREQEVVIGRTKGTGAPLSGGEEFTTPDFARAGRGDKPLIDPSSHVAMTHPTTNNGAQMLRRGYNFTDGTDGLGRLDAGLFFLAYVRNPETQYIPMQTRIARGDLLSEYLKHTGSSLWAIPAGVPDGALLHPDTGAYVGEALFSQ